MESGRNNRIIVILGPTSSGKSDVAIKLARKFNGEIISADSRQIYRNLDIGTGKVTKTEQKMARHWMLDVVSPRATFSAVQFKKKADKIIADILRRGKVPIICGGTGFWIKAVVDNVVFPEVKPDWKLREKLNKKPAKQLFAMLKKLDPQRAKNIDAKNPVRLIRAIEIAKVLRKVPKLSSQSIVHGSRYEFLQIGISIPKEKLHKNIKTRLSKRWSTGMIAEVQKLKKSGLGWKKIQSFGLSYFWIPLYLQKKISKEELFEKVYFAEKDYAKRQMTWFKKDPRIKWLKKYAKIEKETGKFLYK